MSVINDIGDISDMSEIVYYNCNEGYFQIKESPSISSYLLESISFVFANTSFIEKNTLCLKTHSLISYLVWKEENIFTLEHAEKMLENIIDQIYYLERKDQMIFGVDLEDIFVVDNYSFFILPQNKCMQIENGLFHFCLPFAKSFFTCPEIFAITKLPIKLRIENAYFMVGQLCIFCLFNKNILRGNEVITEKELDKILFGLKYSSLYWAIQKCLKKEGNERELFFIQ